MRFSVSRAAARALLLAATVATCIAQAQAQDSAAYADAVRLLEQSTFGPNDALVAHVMQVGTQVFLNEQYAAPASKYPALKYVPAG